jgi:DNA-binding transcriptional MocR family regulator
MPAFPDGDGISFTSARPAQQLFPLEAFRETCAEVIASSDAAGILQLGSPYGYAPLRDYLRLELETNGLHGDGDDLLITNGCQQAIDLLHRLFCSPGDVVAIEDTVYPGLRNVFNGGAARLVGLSVGEEGVEIDAVERVLSRERPKLLVVTPNFQNPTGATMPLAARQALLRIAREAGSIVVENDVYGELRYVGARVPTLKELDESGSVIQIKSYSKVAFPGLRVGWVVGPGAVITRLAELRQRADLHGDQLSQAVLLRFSHSGRLGEHREKILAAGRERLSAVLDACAAHLPEGTVFTRPEGGMNLWVRLPEPLDAADLLPRAVRAGVSYLPGRYFAVARAASGSLRLSFAGLAPEQIRSGLATLGRLFQAELDRVRASRRDAAPAIV